MSRRHRAALRREFLRAAHRELTRLDGTAADRKNSMIAAAIAVDKALLLSDHAR